MHAEDTVGPILDVFSYKAVTRRSVSKVSFRCNESSKVSEFLSAHPSSLLARSVVFFPKLCQQVLSQSLYFIKCSNSGVT